MKSIIEPVSRLEIKTQFLEISSNDFKALMR